VIQKSNEHYINTGNVTIFCTRLATR